MKLALQLSRKIIDLTTVYLCALLICVYGFLVNFFLMVAKLRINIFLDFLVAFIMRLSKERVITNIF